MAGEIATAFVSIIPSFQGGGTALTKQVTAQGAVAGAAGGKEAGSKFGTGMVAGAKSFAGPLAAVFAIGAAKDFFTGAMGEADEARKTSALTEAAIKSTGGAANLSADQIGDLSTKLSGVTGIDDEAVQAGANMLLTFTNIKDEVGDGNIFGDATAASLDMAAAFGGDATSNAKLLGKALNDPIAGVSSLSRVGVQFTDDQKAVIASLVETGDTAGAQRLILGELEKQTGGAAAAMATPADKAKVAWANFQEMLGTALIPTIDRVLAAGTAVLGWATEHTGVMRGLGAVILAGTAGFLAYKAVMVGATLVTNGIKAATVAWTAAQKLLNLAMRANPIGIIVTVLALLVAGFIYAYKNSETFRNIVNGVWAAIRSALDVAWAAIKAVFDAIVAAFKWVWDKAVEMKDGIGAAFQSAVDFIGGIPAKVTAFLTGMWTFIVTEAGELLTGITTKFTEVMEYIGGIPGLITEKLGDLGELLKDAGANIIQGLVDGIGDSIDKVGDVMGDVAGAITDKLPWSPAKSGPLRSHPPQLGGKNIANMLAEGMLAEESAVASAAGRLAGATQVGVGSVRLPRGTSGVSVGIKPGAAAGAAGMSVSGGTTIGHVDVHGVRMDEALRELDRRARMANLVGAA